MVEIVASIFAFALFLFLTFIFWKLAEDSDNTILSALFGTLTMVFIILAVVSVIAFVGFLLEFGGIENG